MGAAVLFKLGFWVVDEAAEVSSWHDRWAASQVGPRFVSPEMSLSGHTEIFCAFICFNLYLLRAYQMPGIALSTGYQLERLISNAG